MRTEHAASEGRLEGALEADRKYLQDLILLRHRPVADRALRFSRGRDLVSPPAT